MRHTVALWIAVAAFGAGLAYRVSAWFRNGFAPGERGAALSRAAAAARGAAGALRGRAAAAARSLVADVLLQRRVRRLGAARWVAHELAFVSFTALLLLHALGGFFFPGHPPTLNPLLFLRDLFGAALLAGIAVAAHRRFVRPIPRRDTRPADAYLLAILAVVVLSGFLLEAVKIGSRARFQSMVREYASEADEAPLEAWWAREGIVSPGLAASEALVARGREIHEASCAPCHSRPQSAFVGWAVAAALRPVAPRLDAAGAPGLLWLVHFTACLAGLALLPFTKAFHLLATPLSLVVNAAAGRREISPANAATKRMIELDACVHCCACSARCAMAMAADAAGNANVLPSEKIAALRALASGGPLRATELRALQEGICLCTSCERCAVACPAGIDLVGMWHAAREAILARGEPAYALLSPLSLRRRLQAPQIGEAAYREAVERPRSAVAARAGSAADADPATVLVPGDDRLWSALRRSLQASTVAGCFGCKACSTACPVVRSFDDPQRALGLLPHQLTHAARMRLWGLVLGSNMLWECLGCYACQEHCPQGVGVTDVVYELKNLAIARAAAEAGTEARP